MASPMFAPVDSGLTETSVVNVSQIITVDGAIAETQKYYLEKYEVANLKIWSVWRSRYSGKLVAHIMDPEGFIHHVEVGEKLGKRGGFVYCISRCTVYYKELISDGKNGWKEV